MTKTSALAAMSAVLLLTAACSSAPGTPSPAPSSTASGPSSAGPSSTVPGVPKVTAPLNADKYEQDPCALLTQAQVSQSIGGVRNSSKDNGGGIPMCNWHGEDGNNISVGLIRGQGGLSASYKNSQTGGGGYFEPAPNVSGYPAVFSAAYDDRKSGGCEIAVGITDDEVFTVGAGLRPSSPSYNDPCSLVTKAAELVVAKLKEGA